MSLARAVQRGRKAAEGLMTDTCVIRRAAGAVFDETTGQYENTYDDVYTGRCRVQTRDLQPSNPEAGGWTATVTTYEVAVPAAVTAVAPDDVVEVTASAHDPALAGRRLRVQSVPTKSHATARRLLCDLTEA